MTQLGFSVPFDSGFDAISLTADTDADTGQFTNIDLKPLSVSPFDRTQSRALDFLALASPPRFPEPGRVKASEGRLLGAINYQLDNAKRSELRVVALGAIDSIVPFGSPVFYQFEAPVEMVLPDVTLTGTFEAIGPTTTVSKPISMVMSRALVGEVIVTIASSATFGNGFLFRPARILRALRREQHGHL